MKGDECANIEEEDNDNPNEEVSSQLSETPSKKTNSKQESIKESPIRQNTSKSNNNITVSNQEQSIHNEEEEENKLLSYLDELSKNKIRFALSNVLSTDNKTNIILQGWLNEREYNCHHLNFSYKNSNYHKKNIAKTDEVLITNY